MSAILQILSLIFVVLWTARLARNKGRNPLAWAAVAAVPAVGLLDIVPEWLTIFSMLPMLALVFMPTRRPVPTDGSEDSTVACPRCQHAHDPGPSFCTNCGWELARPYANLDGSAESADATVNAATESPADAVSTAEHPAAPPAAGDAAAPTPEPTLAAQQTGEPEAATATHTFQPEPEPAPAFTAAPLKITRPLTAAGMTELGLSLFNQGRVREAVDQFTKAIALDPRYREAWANRAKAYTELGLSEKAAADRQQLEAI